MYNIQHWAAYRVSDTRLQAFVFTHMFVHNASVLMRNEVGLGNKTAKAVTPSGHASSSHNKPPPKP